METRMFLIMQEENNLASKDRPLVLSPEIQEHQ